MGLGQCDQINRMITLSVITISGGHCIGVLWIYTIAVLFNSKGKFVWNATNYVNFSHRQNRRKKYTKETVADYFLLKMDKMF